MRRIYCFGGCMLSLAYSVLCTNLLSFSGCNALHNIVILIQLNGCYTCKHLSEMFL